jgi:hypothetical protein
VQVVAFATPGTPDWRWRIVNYVGEMVEESYRTFPTIAAAVAAGAQRRQEMDAADIPGPGRLSDPTSRPRHR